MITGKVLKNIGKAIAHVRPEEVRRNASRSVRVGLTASSGEMLAAMEEFLAPPDMPHAARIEALRAMFRTGEPGAPAEYDIELCEPGVGRRGAYTLDFSNPDPTLREIIDEHGELALPLARLFPPFRKEACRYAIRKVCRENALFCLATALPNVAPSFLAMPWAVGEFASDTAFLTVNQIRLAFLLAAANRRAVGYAHQRNEIASIIAGAFGWRALARELAGKVPFGSGLVAKTAVAYAGTWVVGRGLEHYYRFGERLSTGERRSEYQRGYESGWKVAETLLGALTSRNE